jgi:hypothetical protein
MIAEKVGRRDAWETTKAAPMTMHDFKAKHWIIAAVIALIAVGMLLIHGHSGTRASVRLRKI